MAKRTYQPKGGMCRNCYHMIFDCSHLDFSGMRPITKPDKDGVVIVKCTHFSDNKQSVKYEQQFL